MEKKKLKKTKTKPKAKIKKINTKVKPKTKKKSYPSPNFRTLKVKAKMKKPRKKKTGKTENIDIGKLMRKHAYVEINNGNFVKREYLNISPSAVKEYISRIVDATEINMQLIAERVYLGHNRKTIMVKYNKDKADIDDITDHFGEKKSKVIDGDKEGVLQ